MDPIYKSLLNILKTLENEEAIMQKSFALYEKEKLPREQRRYNDGYNLTEQVEYKHLNNKNSDSITGTIIG